MTTIFTETLSSDNNGNTNYSFRQVVEITGNAQGQVRVTFKAASNVSTNGNFTTNHCAIGISTQSTAYGPAGGPLALNTTAKPVELTFGGVSGFNLTANGQTIVSDWINLSGFTTTNMLVVVMDWASTGGGDAFIGSGLSNAGLWYLASAATYNVAAPTGSWSGAPGELDGVTLIETQAAPVTVIAMPRRAIVRPRRKISWSN